MTGILSLVDVLLNIPAATLLDELQVVDEVRGALLDRAGPLGDLLSVAIALERDEPGEVKRALARLPTYDRATLLALQLSAVAWSNEMTSTATGADRSA